MNKNTTFSIDCMELDSIDTQLADSVKFTSDSGGLIPIAEVKELIAAHKSFTPEALKDAPVVNSYFFGKDKFQELLNHPDALGVRIHFGRDEENMLKLVAFPADKNGRTIFIKDQFGFDFGLNIAVPCPVHCPTEDPK